MAYRSNGSFSLPSTVSYLPSNLSCCGNQVVSTALQLSAHAIYILTAVKQRLMFLFPFSIRQSSVKFHEVNISNYSSGESTKVTLNAKTSVFQARLVCLHAEIFLVVASSDGTHIYMNGGQELKFFLPIGVSASEDSNGKCGEVTEVNYSNILPSPEFMIWLCCCSFVHALCSSPCSLNVLCLHNRACIRLWHL